MAEEALKSTDPTQIKNARSVVKGKVTSAVNSIEALEKNSAGEFIHAKISRTNALASKTKLDTNFELIRKLHEHYCSHRERGKDDAAEEALVDKDEEYITEIELNAHKALDVFTEYELSVAAQEKAKVDSEVKKAEDKARLEAEEIKSKKMEAEIVKRELALMFPKEAYLSDKKAAKEVLDKVKNVGAEHLKDSSEVLLCPAESMIQSLTKNFDSYKKSVFELAEMLGETGKSKEDIDRSVDMASLKVEQEEFSIQIASLSRIQNAQKLVEADRSQSSVLYASTPLNQSPPTSSTKVSPIKFDKLQSLKFSGNPRDFATFKRNFEMMVVPNRDLTETGMYLKQSVPKKFEHLIANVELGDWKQMMSILQGKFGRTFLIVESVVADIEKFKPITGEKADRMFIEFAETLEKIERDLKCQNLLDEVSNASVIGKIQSKLPIEIEKKWAEIEYDEKLLEKSSKDRFSRLMTFMAKYKEIVENRAPDVKMVSGKTFTSFVTGVTFTAKVHPGGGKTKQDGPPNSVWVKNLKPCLACDDGATNKSSIMHRLSECEVWKSLTLAQKKDKVQCIKHPWSRDHTTLDCKFKSSCWKCKSADHHQLFCPVVKTVTKVGHVTHDDGESCAELPPVLLPALYVRGVKGIYGTLMDNCSTDNYVVNDIAIRQNLKSVREVKLEVEGMCGEITQVDSKVYLVDVKEDNGKVTVLECYGVDLIAKDTNLPDAEAYAALCRKFGISPGKVRRPEKIDLLISMRESHLMPDKVKTLGKLTLHSSPFGATFGGSDPGLRFGTYQKTFKSTAQVIPLVKAVTLKASTVLNRVAMKEILVGVKHCGEGCLDGEEKFGSLACPVKPASSTTLLGMQDPSKDLLAYFKEESIGVECSPRCGNCLCGKCALGSKKMSLSDERKYVDFQSRMRYEEEGTQEDPGPYFVVEEFPFIIPKEELVYNYPAVLRVMNSTAKKLEKNVSWRKIYETQLSDLVKKGFAREVSVKEVEDWKLKGGKTYYIAHQMALNPQSKSTPIRTVFNSSQVYRGYSLNSSWSVGPENIMNNMTGILLRFREDIVGAQGDITKMFYMVRISIDGQMMQLFIWRFEGEEEIRTFCMTRLVMGNNNSTNFSTIAVNNTAELEDFPAKYPDAHEALTKDTYVDNVLIVKPTIDDLKKTIEEIELVSARGGFFYKPWIISGQDVPHQVIPVALPNAGSIEEEKALGMKWNVLGDTFSVNAGAVLGGGKKCGEVVAVVVEDNDASLILNPELKLTLRICLSVHAKAYDPLGLVLPTKMVGALLFRKTLQFINAKFPLTKADIKVQKGRIRWDFQILDFGEGNNFLSSWVKYFGMLESLGEVVFPRSYKPVNVDPDIKPDLFTFSDGNEDAFGCPAYARWTLLDGSRVTNLIMSKAKLGPLTHKGEVVKNELSGATYAARLKCWIMEHTNVDFGDHVHFLDSRIVQDMIVKESYGFNTFAGLRVGEIQKKTDIMRWLHIPSEENIADILTKGATPDQLRPGTVWQHGPAWLVCDEDYWPVTARAPLSIGQQETVRKFEKSIRPVKPAVPKTTTQHSVVFLSGSRQVSKVRTEKVMKIPADMSFSAYNLDSTIVRCGSLRMLIRATCYFLRMVGRRHLLSLRNGEIDSSAYSFRKGEISQSEYDDAWNFLISWEQSQRLDKRKCQGLCPVEVQVPLQNYPISVSHVILSGRVKNIPQGFSANSRIPIIPRGCFGKLIARHYHNKYHVDVDATVAHVRADVWVVEVRKMVTNIDKHCVICKIKRTSTAMQVMGDLPSYRYDAMSPPWTVVLMDLWGPLVIRDDCIKKGPRVFKKVWGVLFSCSTTRAVSLDVALDYGTESVLHTIRRLMANKGDVREIVSDPGSQLKGAARELSDWRKNWDPEELVRFGADKGLKWSFIMADSQHQNGGAESLIKVVKGIMKSMVHAIGGVKLSLNELNTLLAECGNLANERPIGMKPNSQTDPEYLSPNSLLLGRSSSRISSGPFSSSDSFSEDPKQARTRFQLVQLLTDQFWKTWQKLFFPTLLIRQKWHHEKRNVQVGDVCLLQDSNNMRGEWRLCKVVKVHPSRNNVVRNVDVEVAARYGGALPYKYQTPYTLSRHVSRLLVLVAIDEPVEEVSNSVMEEGAQARLKDTAVSC